MKLSYFNTTYNFGDLLSITLLNDMFGVKKVVHETSVQRADMIAIGSIFQKLIKDKPKQLTLKGYLKKYYRMYSNPKIEVFGTGFIRDQDINGVELIRRLNIIALRGVYTKQKLDSISGKKNKITLGDPGLLCKELIDTTKIKKKFKLGIVPHYADKKSKFIYELEKSNSGSKIIDIQQEPYAFLREISQCEMILSSAMHGLIASDSLNIPNLRLIVSDNLAGGDFKFNDYYSVFGIENHNKLDLFKKQMKYNNILNLIEVNFIDKSNQVDKINNDLLKSFKRKSKFA